MWLQMVSLVLLSVFVLVPAVVFTAILLALGTAFAWLFRVSVWEATLVLALVAAGVYRFLTPLPPIQEEEEEEEVEEPPVVVWPRVPPRGTQGKQKRRR